MYCKTNFEKGKNLAKAKGWIPHWYSNLEIRHDVRGLELEKIEIGIEVSENERSDD